MKSKFVKLFRICSSRYLLNNLIQFHVAASVEHNDTFRNLLRYPFATIVDIGANRGQFALLARQKFPDSKIISFEPLEEPARILNKLFANDKNIKLYQLAIGPEDKASHIHVSKADDSSSLLEITDLQNTLFPGTSEKETRTIQEKPLDAILSKGDIKSPAFLKMDVQGFELQALEGCKSLLPSFIYLYIECSFVELYAGQSLVPDVIAFLRENGFDLEGIYNLGYDKNGRAIQGDFLFKNNAL